MNITTSLNSNVLNLLEYQFITFEGLSTTFEASTNIFSVFWVTRIWVQLKNNCTSNSQEVKLNVIFDYYMYTTGIFLEGDFAP